MQEKGGCLAEGVTLSGAYSKDCRRIALRRSPFSLNQKEEKTKDAEGVKLKRANLSGKRTEKTVISFEKWLFLCNAEYSEFL